MTSFAELNDIALTLLQVTGLLLPVVFLTVSFVKKEGLNQFSEGIQQNMRFVLISMISLLAITGFFATFGILRTSVKDLFIFISVLSLAAFFLLYGAFTYLLTKSGR